LAKVLNKEISVTDNLTTPELEKLLGESPEVAVDRVIYCPEEESQLGDVFYTSEEALATAEDHNQANGHNACVALVSNTEMAEVSSGQNLPWPFCFLYNGSPYYSLIVYAPSTGEAVDIVEIMLTRWNFAATQLGYQPLFSAVAGACPRAVV
jgi:hypothetical protein